MQFPPSALTSLLFLSTMVSITLSPCVSFHMRDQISHPYETTVLIIVLCTSVLKFVDTKREEKRYWTDWYEAMPEFNLLFLSSCMHF
jgi:hypothetical protein